ncbi:MAG: caspase family protein, partial [Proteobacteria bacterium]|nr:caspase family protein [Pseudomonadota bacterium]
KLAPARLSMVILDACRNNPFERRFRGGGQGLAQINAPTGTLIAYATAPGKVAADGEGRNGLYTSELLAAMDAPGIKIEDVFKRVRTNVIKKSNEAQTPWESSSLTGDFYFRTGATGGAQLPSRVTSQIDSASLEFVFWDSAERSNTEADYTAYLSKYPDGQFAELARNRIKKPSGGTQLASIQTAPQRDPKLPVAALALPKVGDFWRYRGSNNHGVDNPTYTVTDVRANSIEIRHTTNANEQMTDILNAEWNPLAQLGQKGAEGEIRAAGSLLPISARAREEVARCL